MLFIAAVVAGAYFAYQYFTTPDFQKNERFAVINKDIVAGASFSDESRKTALGATKRVTYPAKHLLIVMGEHTRDEYIVVVDESTYRYTPLRTILSRSELTHYPNFESYAEMQAHYKDVEQRPEPAEGENFIDKLLSLLSEN